MLQRPLNVIWCGLAVFGLALFGTGLARGGDQAFFQGTWKVTFAELGTANGVVVADANARAGMSVIIDGDQLTLVEGANREVVTFTAKPIGKAIDFHSAGIKRYHGIYKFEGNTLKLCWGPAGAARPTKFGVNKLNQHRYYILQK